MHVNAALTLFSNTLLESKNKEMGAVAQRAFICQKNQTKNTLIQRDTERERYVSLSLTLEQKLI